jgi:hypothetical protein
MAMFLNIFHGIKNVDFKLEPVYAWYSVFYKHKSQYSFYPIYNNFISEFKKLIFGQSTSRLSLEATVFLSGKGVYELFKEFTVTRLFGSKEKPFILPFYTSDKLFVEEVCRKYNTWAHLFHDKRKKQFIPLLGLTSSSYLLNLTNDNVHPSHPQPLPLSFQQPPCCLDLCANPASKAPRRSAPLNWTPQSTHKPMRCAPLGLILGPTIHSKQKNC